MLLIVENQFSIVNDNDFSIASTAIQCHDRVMDWKARRIFVNGNLASKSLLNAILYIDNLYPNLYGLNKQANQVYVITKPSWDNTSDFKPREIEETDFIYQAAELEPYGIDIGVMDLQRAIKAVAAKTPYKTTYKYTTPVEWLERVQKEINGHQYAYPQDLFQKLMPGQKKYKRGDKSRVYAILKKLGFRSVTEACNGKIKSACRWKRVLNPDSAAHS